MQYKSEDAVGFEFRDLPDNFRFVELVVPKPEWHQREFTRWILECVQIQSGSSLEILSQLEGLFDLDGDFRLVMFAAVEREQTALATDHCLNVNRTRPDALDVADRVAGVVLFELRAFEA